jgi:hypothetical protein
MTTDQCFSDAKEGKARRGASSYRPSEGQFEGCWQEASDCKPEVSYTQSTIFGLFSRTTRLTSRYSDNRKKTGLVSNWQSMVPAVSRGSSKAGSSKAKSGTSGNPSALGGLDDEDAVATPLKNAGRYRRKNDVRVIHCPLFRSLTSLQTVAIESVSESDTDAKTSKAFRKSVKRTAALDHKVKPNFPKSKSHSTSMKDLKAKLERASVVPSESPTSTDLSGSLAMGSDTTGLPDFARSAWSTSFLPTLYSRLGSSSNPFVLGADMVQVIQEVVNLVYPNSDYQVRVNDRIFTLVWVSFTLFYVVDMRLGKGPPER